MNDELCAYIPTTFGYDPIATIVELSLFSYMQQLAMSYIQQCNHSPCLVVIVGVPLDASCWGLLSYQILSQAPATFKNSMINSNHI